MNPHPSALLLCAALSLAACKKSGPAPADLASFVNPFIGTGGLGFGVGSTYPGPARPFGMIHPGPDTRALSGAPGFNHCAGYWWEDDYIEGFSMTRMEGTGVPDYGVVAFMPTLGMDDSKRSELGYMMGFDHAKESASLGRYTVTLEDGTGMDIATGLRTALLGVSWPGNSSDPVLILDLEHTIGDASNQGGEVFIDADGKAVSGWMHNLGNLSNRIGGFPIWVRAEFDTAATDYGVWGDSALQANETQAAGVDLGAWFRFPPGTTSVTVRVSISFVDATGALAHQDEVGWDLDRLAEKTEAAWRKEMTRVDLTGVSDEEATLFATALYRSLSMPTLWTDADGRTRRVDGSIGMASGTRYTDFSLWDTYRTLHPWLMFLEDSRNPDLLASLVAIGEEGGALPRWQLAHGDIHSMIGDPAVIVAAEAQAKGVTFDQDKALELALLTAYAPAPGPTGGRGGVVVDYENLGYVPQDLAGGSVAQTLEFAAADLALAQWMDRVGQDGSALRARGVGAAQALYDEGEGFFKPKNADGSWADWAGPSIMEGAYTEGTAWQYLWLLFQDTEALAQILGGRDAALDRLRQFFDQSRAEEATLGMRTWYWHGNEPDLHAAWLFSAWGEMEEGKAALDWVVDTMYSNGPDGLAGNDDGATLSSWLLFAHAGLYPIAGTDAYVLSVPRQERMVLHRPSGDLVIEAEPDPHQNNTISRILLDGVERDPKDSILRHAELQGHHILRFELEE